MKFKEIWPRVSEEKSFKGVDGWMTDGKCHNSSSLAFGSGELKNKNFY